MFSWWFGWVFRIINVYQCFITSSVLFDKADRGLKHEIKNIWFDTIYMTCIMCHTMYIVYWKNSYRWSELMACSYTCREKNTVQKKMSMRNWDDRPLYQKSRFFITSRRVGLSLYISHSRKALKCLLQNIYLLLDLLYHKHNPLIITNVEDSIF